MDEEAALMDARWQQALAQFELWVSIWAENPQAARNAGPRVEELMMPLGQVQERYRARFGLGGYAAYPVKGATP